MRGRSRPWLVRLATRLVPRGWRQAISQDLEDEARDAGRGPAWQARQALGVAWKLRRARGGDRLMFDVRYTLRSLWHAKGFTFAAILTFSLGIGINIAVFSIVDRLMFRPLPFAEPDRLVHLHNGEAMGVTPAPLLDRRVAARLWERSRTLGGLALARGTESAEVVEGFGAAPVSLAAATANLLDVLRIRPVAGRGFTPDAERPQDGPREVLLTQATWRNRFGGSLDVLERTFGTGDDRYRVVGVLPADFVLPSSFLTERTDGLVVERNVLATMPSRFSVSHAAVARLEPGATLEQARAEVDTLLAELRADSPEEGMFSSGVTLQPLQDGLFYLYAPYLRLLVVAVGLVMLIACANLATLMLARGRSHAHEAALRVALGASSRRLVSAAVLEAFVLCAVSSAVALLLCWWAQAAIVSLVPPTFRSFAVSALDPRLVGLTLTAAFACALVVSLVPALAARRTDPAMALSHRERGRAGGRLRGGRTLLAIEAAFGILLVAGAGATGRSFYGLVFGDQGFVASDLYVVTFNGVPARSDDAMTNRRLGFAMASDVLGTLPSVRAIGAVTQSPVGTGFAIQPFWRSQNLEGREYGVGPGAFEALGTPVLFGRGFTEADVATAAPVAIVNARGARALWPDQPVEGAVGRHLTTRGGMHTVVGVVPDIRPVPAEPAHASLFLPITDPDARMIINTAFQLVVRTAAGQTPDVAALERTLAEVSPGTRVAVEAVADELAPWLERPRFQAMLFAALAGLSLLLAAVGLFAVTAFEVTQRRYEMGVRLALGATGRDVGRLVLATAVRPVLMGSAAGLVAAWWAGQFLQAFLVDVDARDPGTYGLVALTLVGTAMLAAWLPARRAARTDPASVLRAS